MWGNVVENEKLLKTLKLAVIAAFMIAFVAAIFYLVYGFFFMWQGIVWGIMTTFLIIIVFLLLILVSYLWIKTIWLKKALERYKSEINEIKSEN
jgi:uncharacterized membrane protein